VTSAESKKSPNIIIKIIHCQDKILAYLIENWGSTLNIDILEINYKRWLGIFAKDRHPNT